MKLRITDKEFDVIIVGGGATGAGAALDAAARGLSVVLLEAHDFGSGTSSRSTKLIHGGVRYLENAIKRLDRVEYSLVHEGLEERKLFLSIAPHLTSALPLLTPCYRWYEVPFYFIGLTLYDWISGRRSLGRTRIVSAAEAVRRFPGLRPDGLKAAIAYYDGEFNDARVNLALVLTAMAHGAEVANYVEVEGLLKKAGGVVGVRVSDRSSGESWDIRGKVVINATGPFIDALRRLDDPSVEALVVPSAGSHIAVRTLPGKEGILIPRAPNGSVAFFKPFEGAMLIGTTEERTDLTFEPKTTAEHVEYLRKLANQYLAPTHQVQPEDVLAVWTGIRPLVRDPGGRKGTVQLSRTHVVEVSPSRLVTIGGGKWTSFSRMASDVVDRAVRVAGLSCGPSRRQTTRLVGATDHVLDVERELCAALEPDVARHLAHNYGTQAAAVAALASGGPSARLAPGHPYLEAEVTYAVQQELALEPDDVLSRRTRLAFIDESAALAALPRVVDLMTPLLGWTPAEGERRRLDTAALYGRTGLKSL